LAWYREWWQVVEHQQSRRDLAALLEAPTVRAERHPERHRIGRSVERLERLPEHRGRLGGLSLDGLQAGSQIGMVSQIIAEPLNPGPDFEQHRAAGVVQLHR